MNLRVAKNFLPALAVVALTLLSGGCMKEDMSSQPKQKTGSESAYFADGAADRPLINGTVPRGMPMIDDSPFPTQPAGAEATAFPFQLTSDDLTRGQLEFDIYCSVCHGRLGDGRGMIPMRGFVQPPSYYNPRLRAVPVGHFYNVITHGYGAMYSYNDRIVPDDRWRIAGYIRVLQASDPQDDGSNVPDNNRRK